MEFWEAKHQWMIDDLNFELQQRSDIALLLRKHPDDKTGDIFREMIKEVDKKIAYLKKQYKMIYGVNLRSIHGRS